MLLTVWMLLAALAVIVVALGIGHFAQKNEIYLLGVVLLLFVGLMVITGGISYAAGEELNWTVASNESTTQLSTIVYDTWPPIWNRGVGLLCVVLAGGLALHFYQAEQDRKREERDSIDVPD